MVKQGANESVRRGGASLRNGFFFKLDLDQQRGKDITEEGKMSMLKVVRIVTCRTSSEGTSCNDNNSCLCWERTGAWSPLFLTLLVVYPRLCCICPSHEERCITFQSVWREMDGESGDFRKVRNDDKDTCEFD